MTSRSIDTRTRASISRSVRAAAFTLLAAWAVCEIFLRPPATAAQTDPAGGARIEGVIRVTGVHPKPNSLPVFKNRPFCGASVPDETMLMAPDGGLRNAAVLLRPTGVKAVTSADHAVLDNRNCAFTPHVQVVAPGTQLLLKNSDPILHTVRARLGRETLFNVGLPRWRRVVKSLDRPGIVRIDCDVLHTWMTAVIVVADTPYHALSDESGRFTIDGVPPGNYTLESWHERLGTKTASLTLLPGERQSIFVLYAAQQTQPRPLR